MANGRLEHVNISVTDAQRTARLFENLCGWHRRWEGPAMNGGHTIHLGDSHSYVALYTSTAVRGDFAKGAPMNHIGIVVDDLDATEGKVVAAGLTPINHGDYEPGRRFYFFDWDGIEWEVISYE